MRKKGFTLIELLTVIAILSLIILIAFVSISSILKQTKTELSDSQKKAIEAAAQSWSADNMDLLPSNSNCSFILLKDLKNDGLLDEKIIDPKSEKNISNNLIIKIASTIKAGGKSVLSYEVDSNDVDMCDYIGLSAYVKVDLPSGLTPVVYDGNNWKVADKSSDEWYDYDEQKWANAVTLLPGIKKKPGDKVAVDGTEASMMFVWIPRFEYKIDGDYGKGGTSATDPGEIEVNFISKNTIMASSDEYKIHPAFTFDGEKSGFWVGKFELSHETLSKSTSGNNLGCTTSGTGVTCTVDATKFRVLPNKASLRLDNVSNFWYGIKTIENTSSFGLSNIDIHMMKNSEWGAVAYLSQSKYGNTDYEGVSKEVYQNKSEEYITGSSNGTPSQDASYTQCTYDQTKGTDTNQDQKNCGPGASTTGNIYGVYDMSGGSWEYVMGVYGDSNGIYSGYTTSSNSGFNGRTGSDNGEITNKLPVPDSKYYDKYTTTTSTTACNNGVCYGHALSETSGWYGDFKIMIDTNSPWFLRGGSFYDNTGAGVFDFVSYYGNGSSGNSTRVVGIIK